ncbi:hypothetical protein N7478_001920 [Penicillium angulare]|uniref:uncharacterized protein n=1 Tax=Penicillium angulare TaxID=116970 RepID=UPI00253F6B92|nr:uncharacterized protein N7478_001920 [Penicillium angulare]KAJ5288890.1 hypothetical protein N7478_001920 [Penicillium angulare]
MDKLKDLGSKLSGGSSSGSKQSSSSGNEDYLDKAVDSAETKFGGGKVDPHSQKVRDANEKATDFARGKFEGATGKNVPDKFSN